MTTYLAESTDLAAVANAIRAKGGTTASLAFPSGFVSAISAIATGGGGITVDDIAMRTISGIVSGNTSFIGSYAFAGCRNLTTASFPACTSIGGYAFNGCSSLATVSFPACMSISGYAFYNCFGLTTVSFPACTSISTYAFYTCRNLTTASFASTVNLIGSSAFRSCYKLISLYLTGVSKVPTLSAGVFSSTPIGGYSASAGQYGSVFVPSSLYASFLKATNWKTISARIVSV